MSLGLLDDDDDDDEKKKWVEPQEKVWKSPGPLPHCKCHPFLPRLQIFEDGVITMIMMMIVMTIVMMMVMMIMIMVMLKRMLDEDEELRMIIIDYIG